MSTMPTPTDPLRAHARRLPLHWLMLLALAVTGCSQVELYSNLPEQEANEMMAVLIDHGISCSKSAGSEGTWSLKVASDQFAPSVRALKELGFPRDKFSDMGTVFQKSGLVSSPSEERIRFMHALSQELSKTLSQIDGVMSARVHIVLPENNPFGESVKPSSAAVFIKYRQGATVEAMIPQIKELVLSSIEGMTADKVTVSVFEADPPKTNTEADAGQQFADVAGVRVAKESVRKLWTILGACAGVAVLCLLALGWMALKPAPRGAAA
ncbi:MAG TPA: type III secretion inner membrane ring lipoprotein SctJ [Caulifigura sp.]|nr:type III secretion inner membrane ring lipoprotein SctJ [Caulifigura sp.]